jgi:hypothetical protein
MQRSINLVLQQRGARARTAITNVTPVNENGVDSPLDKFVPEYRSADATTHD